MISSVDTLSLSLVSSPSLKCSASSSRAAASLAVIATRPDTETLTNQESASRHCLSQSAARTHLSLASVRSRVSVSRNTARTVVSSTPVRWNSDTITRSTTCSYLATRIIFGLCH